MRMIQKTIAMVFLGDAVTVHMLYHRHSVSGYYRGWYSLGTHIPGTKRWLHLWLPDTSNTWRCLVYERGVLADGYGDSPEMAARAAEGAIELDVL